MPRSIVLLPYKFTLLSNQNVFFTPYVLVLLPYKFTLLSNQLRHAGLGPWGFYYPINLHYSQTRCAYNVGDFGFYYPINLHYSQTVTRI